MGVPDSAGVSAPAVPSYTVEHSGTVLVCGFGPGFHDDLERARRLRPDAAVIAVNEAVKAVDAFAFFTLHPEKIATRWRPLMHQHRGKVLQVHSGGKSFDKRARIRGVDHWWPEAGGGGTSVWAAQRMARLMGFDERILIGAPLAYGNYADGNFAKMFRQGRRRRGDGRDVVQAYRDFVAADTAWHDGCYSLSGFTREVLGEPR